MTRPRLTAAVRRGAATFNALGLTLEIEGLHLDREPRSRVKDVEALARYLDAWIAHAAAVPPPAGKPETAEPEGMGA